MNYSITFLPQHMIIHCIKNQREAASQTTKKPQIFKIIFCFWNNCLTGNALYLCFYLYTYASWASLVVQTIKNLPAMQEIQVQSLGQEDSPAERSSSPLQYSCLENPMNRGAWLATVHRVTESGMTERLTLSTVDIDAYILETIKKPAKKKMKTLLKCHLPG